MSSDPVIAVKNLSKAYTLWSSPAARLHGPFLGQIGQIPFLPSRLRQLCQRASHEAVRNFFALRDISFELHRGESMGIIGRNGSGKSTLLQIIVGTLQPTEGNVMVRGRIGALLELGSGFNPEFSGRENVFLNAAILGLSREETEARFEEIAAFAAIGDFIDQPVKTYSSGMLVRLAFAVQVQIEPEILVVDEALAVGDALFQKRCFQRMESLVANGTTLLFCSHDQESVRTLTSRALLLKDGRCKAYGTSAEVLLEYRQQLHEEESIYFQQATEQLVTRSQVRTPASGGEATDRLCFGDRDAEVKQVKVLDAEDKETSLFYPGDLMKILVTCRVHRTINHLNVAVRLRNKEGIKMYSWGTLNQDIAIWSGRAQGEVFWDREFQAGEDIQVLLEAPCLLGQNLYEIQVSISQEHDRYYGAQRMLYWRDEAAFFHVNMRNREYFFGGVCDLRMKARTLELPTNL